MFRNEGAAGSNPASSTKRPGQGVVGASRQLCRLYDRLSVAPQAPHEIPVAEHLAVTRCSGHHLII
jgi:hypothetical protein